MQLPLQNLLQSCLKICNVLSCPQIVTYLIAEGKKSGWKIIHDSGNWQPKLKFRERFLL